MSQKMRYGRALTLIKPELRLDRLYLIILRSFTTANASIPQMAIYRQWTMNHSTKLLNSVSRKVLTHHDIG